MADKRLSHRGAATNPDGRFERHQRDRVDDGWWQDDDLPPPRTTVTDDASRSVITRNDSPTFRSTSQLIPIGAASMAASTATHGQVTPTSGCRPGLDFETRLFAKPDAPRLLAMELRRPSYRCQTVAIGTNTDPYQPVERQKRIMRGIIEVLAEFRHPVCITTKSALVARDIDLLAPMAAQGLASVAVSITTLDRDLTRRLEPRAALPAKRLAAIGALAKAGIPTSVMIAPVIPALTDHEMESILVAAAEQGATAAGWILLRLPFEVKDLFDDWLRRHAPGRRDHVLSLIRQSRDGKLNDSRFGRRFTGHGPMAELLDKRFRLAARKLGLDASPSRTLRSDLFSPPPQPGDQLRLF